MKLVVGLGNPGRKYEGTRHNVGFEVIAELARRLDVGRPKAKFDAEIAETIIGSEKVALICPLTYMNLSGNSVRATLDFFKLSLDDLMVVSDDLNLALGRLRIRQSGSAGGQNGIKDIIQKVGSQQFARLRIGIERPPAGWDAANYVLGKFAAEDRVVIEKAVSLAADAVESWVTGDIQNVMNRFNQDPNKPEKPKNKKPKDSLTEASDEETKQT